MNDADGTLVSILIPCYNAQEWVGDAIESALTQTYGNKEVIVVDDGSTDESLAVIKTFRDRVRWETGPNRGANAARNRLLELSRGGWLQYLDADDYLFPRKIETQMQTAAETGCDLVVSPCNSDRCLQNATMVFIPWIDLMDLRLGKTTSNLWCKQAIKAAGGWDPTLPCGQEYELMLRMLKSGARVAYCNEALAFARAANRHSVSLRDPYRSSRVLTGVADAAAALALRSGEIPAQLNERAALRVLSVARKLRRHNQSNWQELLRFVGRACPGLGAHLRKVSPIYGGIYCWLGFRVAEWYLALSSPIKRLRRRLVRPTLHS